MSPLRVALDASLFDEPTTGIALYARSLASALEADGHQVLRFGARRSGAVPRRNLPASAFFLGPCRGALLESSAQLLHSVCNFNLPLVEAPGKPYVLTVHDVVPLLLRDTVSFKFRMQFRIWLSRSLKVARRVICVSARTRDDLLTAYPSLDPSKVAVVHSGVDHVDRVPRLDAVGEEYVRTLGLPEHFILYAGALDRRKNLPLLLDAVERLHDGGARPTLVFLGQKWFGGGAVHERILELQARGVDLRALGYQPDPLFYGLLRRATVFVQPSLYEGFGLPPLEAMRLGVPTIVSNAGSLPEVVGDGAIQVPTDDPARLADEIARLLGSATERARLSALGRARTEQFRWDVTAAKTAAVYRDALR